MDGRTIAEEIKLKVAAEVRRLVSDGIRPSLAAVVVGEDPSSQVYLRGKERDCTNVGIDFKLYRLPSDASSGEVVSLVESLNAEDVSGIIVQLPLPAQVDRRRVFSAIDPVKDVDGLHPENVGRLWLGDYSLQGSLLPCTPKGIVRLLDRYDIALEGKLAVIINRSDLVGKPLAKLLLDRNATVVVCHSKTRDLEERTREADILVSGVGRAPAFRVTVEMVKEGAVVIDVGISCVEGKMVGDVDFEKVKEKVSHITPVPGGVGPMTRAMLLENVLIAVDLQRRGYCGRR